MRPIGYPAESTTCTSTAITSTVLRKTVCAEIAATQPAAAAAPNEIRKRWLAPFPERCQPPFTKCVNGRGILILPRRCVAKTVPATFYRPAPASYTCRLLMTQFGAFSTVSICVTRANLARVGANVIAVRKLPLPSTTGLPHLTPSIESSRR